MQIAYGGSHNPKPYRAEAITCALVLLRLVCPKKLSARCVEISPNHFGVLVYGPGELGSLPITLDGTFII